MTRAAIASELAQINQEVLNAAKARARVRLAELFQAEHGSSVAEYQQENDPTCSSSVKRRRKVNPRASRACTAA